MTTQLLEKFTKILLATDGSEYITGAENEAINLAKICDSEIYIMSVVLSNPEYSTLAPKLVKQAEQDAIDCMDIVQVKANSVGIKSHTILRSSEYIYPEIVATAQEQNIDLIVVGRRGKKGLLKLLMGSRTNDVINHVHCSVLVVPRAAKIRGKNILLVIDGSSYSRVAATITAKIAKCFDAPVTIISVSNDDESKETIKVDKFLQEINFDSNIIAGKYAEDIVETAKNIGSDLIVIGDHGYNTGLKKIFIGSVSEKVISLAESAVLVARN
ncbi:universal stress protein [Candidatus Halobeggiatoa sp. HSG11]|nr:universal stress protein [Candidatus Halobeggiatoa sp. HSG11]